MALSRLFTYRGLGQAVSRALAPWRPTDLDLTRSGPAKCQKDELLAIIPDKPGVLLHRIAIRPKHSPNFVKLHHEGYVTWAGPLFDGHVVRGKTRPFKGSVMVVNEKNRKDFMSRIASDVYVKEGVWDLEQAQVIPFRTLLRWQGHSS